ncbi:MAG TPA: hypothetical protein VGB08_03270 [Allosphingosinicella sp.]
MPPADPVILYAGEKETVARRLHEALVAAGYPAALSRIGSDAGEIDSVRRSGAVIVIWSKALMSPGPTVAAIDAARQRGTLIEASADGIAPIPSLDDNRVALLSGWRGEPHHPGWQRILAELKRLCGAPATVAPQRRSVAAAAPAAAPGAAPAATPRTPIRATTLAVVGAVLLLFVGVAAAALIGRSDAPAPQRETVASVTPQSAAPVRQAAAPLAAVPAPEPAPVAAPVTERVASEVQSVPAVEQPRRVQTATARPVKARSVPAPQREPASRYRNARNMRLFCAGSGRSTPQCRSFRRAAGSASAATAPSRSQAPVRYRNARNMRRFCDGAGRDTSQCRLFRSRTASR